MTIRPSRRTLGAALAATITTAALLLSPTAAQATVEEEFSNGDVATMSDQSFVDYSMDEGLYEVSADGSVIVYDTRPLYAAAKSEATAVSPTCIACVDGKWTATKVSGPTRTYGGWTTRASGWGPATLAQSVTITQSNSYTGTLSMAKSAVNAAVGFNISSSVARTTTYTGNVASGKQGFLQTRPVYDNYVVKQVYTVGGYTALTRYVYPKKYAFTDHRITY